MRRPTRTRLKSSSWSLVLCIIRLGAKPICWVSPAFLSTNQLPSQPGRSRGCLLPIGLCSLLPVFCCSSGVAYCQANLQSHSRGPTAQAVNGLPSGTQDTQILRDAAATAARRAANYFTGRVASHGGYVYYYSLDLSRRWGEGEATSDQVWVQPPGTPTVGIALLAAYRATGEQLYLDGAVAAADALVHGQLRSGGWTNCIDFDLNGARSADYRGGGGRGKNNSSLDDGQTQSALELLILVDEATEFQIRTIHEAVQVGLDALLQAQFPCGGFPQVWTGPSDDSLPVVAASYPQYDWRTENRIKEYWNLYTLNDDLVVYVDRTLRIAHQVYGEQRYRRALDQLAEFLLLSQMPEPQPAWAQQYNYDMHPCWARKFEPPAISGSESQQVIGLLLRFFRESGDRRFLKAAQRAHAYLQRSQLDDGMLARYYELGTNRPLYMQRRGDVYSLTYSDRDLPRHYGWKSPSQLGELSRAIQDAKSRPGGAGRRTSVDEADVQRVIEGLDDQGRWVTIADGSRLVGQPRFEEGYAYISSAVFSDNLLLLAEYLRTASQAAER